MSGLNGVVQDSDKDSDTDQKALDKDMEYKDCGGEEKHDENDLVETTTDICCDGGVGTEHSGGEDPDDSDHFESHDSGRETSESGESESLESSYESDSDYDNNRPTAIALGQTRQITRK